MPKKHSLLTLFALLFLIYLAFCTYSTGDRPWIFYNSDNGIPYFYLDMLHGGHINQWEFAPVNNFFPDMLLFFIIAFFVSHIKAAILLFGTTQLILYYALSVTIAKQSLENHVSLIRLSCFSALLLLAGGYFTHKEIFESALTSWLHFGTTLMFLAGLLLLLRTYTSSKNKLNYGLLFIVCFFTTFSDILYIPQFPVPAIISLSILLVLHDKKFKSIHLNNIKIIFIATLTGYAFYRFHPLGLHIHQEHHILQRISLSDLLAALLKLREVLSGFYQSNAIILVSFFSYVIIASAYLGKWIAQKKQPRKEIAFQLTTILLLMSALVGFLSLIFLDNDLMVIDYYGMRHYQPFILFTVFLGIPIALSKSTQLEELANKHYAGFVLILIFCAALFSPAGSISQLIQFYPPSVACLDHYAAQYHLKNGTANYWEARSYRFLSKTHLNIVAITDDIQPYFFSSTHTDYKNNHFDFIISQDPHTLSPSYGPGYYPQMYWSAAYLKRRLGKPLKVVKCPAPFLDGQEKIYVYQKGAISRRWK